eukprot:7015240-Prymnesium_polylepis.1
MARQPPLYAQRRRTLGLLDTGPDKDSLGVAYSEHRPCSQVSAHVQRRMGPLSVHVGPSSPVGMPCGVVDWWLGAIVMRPSRYRWVTKSRV